MLTLPFGEAEAAPWTPRTLPDVVADLMGVLGRPEGRSSAGTT